MVLIEVVQLVVDINRVFKVIFNMDKEVTAFTHRWVGVSDGASRESELPVGVGAAAREWVALTVILHHLFPDLATRDEQQHSQAQQHNSEKGKRQHRIHRRWLRPPRRQGLLLEFARLQLLDLLLDLLFLLRGCVHLFT